MRSIPLAMTWELLQRGRWSLLLGLLGANVTPILVLTALRIDGAIDPDDAAFISLQATLIPTFVFCFAAAIASAQDFTSRAYTLPVPVSTLVVWRMIPGMILIALQTFGSIFMLNAVFGLHWQVWGPTLLAPVALVMVQATLWYSQKSDLLPFGICIPGVILGFWYKSRWGPVFQLPTHAWVSVTPLEIATMLVFVVVSYYVATVGVARSRCGETMGSVGILAWLEVLNLRLENVGPLMARNSQAGPGHRFQTPAEAQFWCEWQKKGWLLPGIVTFGWIGGISIWVVFSRDPVLLAEGLIGSGGILAFVGLMGGLVVGNYGTSDSSCAMGHFTATRPLTNRELATSILKVAAWSVLISWIIWAASSAVVAGLMVATGTMPQSPMISQLRWWYLPGTLLGCWIAASVMASFLLTGRDRLLVTLACWCLVLAVAVLLITKSLDHATQAWIHSSLLSMCGIAIGLAALSVMIAAHHRSLIDTWIVVVGGIVWVAVSAVIIVECQRNPFATIPLAVFLVGIASLSVAPLAAAPLAVGLNRHR